MITAHQFQLTATQAAGYHFTAWSGDATGTDNPLTVVMDGNKSITANFAINTYTLDITAVNGTVAKVPDQASYDHARQFSLQPHQPQVIVSPAGAVMPRVPPIRL